MVSARPGVTEADPNMTSSFAVIDGVNPSGVCASAVVSRVGIKLRNSIFVEGKWKELEILI